MEQFKTIYSQTYNFVYLRAKSILKREEDIQQLMKEVYLKIASEDVNETSLYEWLGKQVYTLGCEKFRKKKVREADIIELESQQYTAQKSIDREMTKQVVTDLLEGLPDMYQATLYAFYYDHMSLKDISVVMGYNVASIINRLNYAHKYLNKALSEYQDDNKVKVQFSIEILCEALRDWSAQNRLSSTTAQNIYGAICRALSLPIEEAFEEGLLAGADKRVVPVDGDEVSAVCQQLGKYSVKKSVNKKTIGIIGGVVVLAIVAVIGVIALEKSGKKEGSEEKPPIVQEEKVETPEDEIESDNNQTDDEQEEAQKPENTEETEKQDVGYLLPKSNTEKLTRADLQGFTAEQLRLARNEIFARYGVVFGKKDLDDYFATKSWYQQKMTMTEFYDKVEMTLIEEANVSLILAVEAEME